MTTLFIQYICAILIALDGILSLSQDSVTIATESLFVSTTA